MQLKRSNPTPSLSPWLALSSAAGLQSSADDACGAGEREVYNYSADWSVEMVCCAEDQIYETEPSSSYPEGQEICQGVEGAFCSMNIAVGSLPRVSLAWSASI